MIDSHPLHELRRQPATEWPPPARASILAGFDDDDDEVRRTAVELAARIVDDELARRLLTLADDDPSEVVAAAAAMALGPCVHLCADAELGLLDDGPLSTAAFDEVKRSLARLYRDATTPTLVRRRALEAAVHAPEPWHRGAVRAAWASQCPFWRTAAVFCMGFVEGFEAQILEALDDDDLAIRREAVLAAGRMQLHEAYPEIVHLAASPATLSSLRSSAVHAMAYLDVPLARQLLARLADSDDASVAGVACCALEERELCHIDSDDDEP